MKKRNTLLKKEINKKVKNPKTKKEQIEIKSHKPRSRKKKKNDNIHIPHLKDGGDSNQGSPKKNKPIAKKNKYKPVVNKNKFKPVVKKSKFKPVLKESKKDSNKNNTKRKYGSKSNTEKTKKYSSKSYSKANKKYKNKSNAKSTTKRYSGKSKSYSKDKKVKASYKQRLSNTKRYYQKRLGYHLSQFNQSSLSNPQEKKRVQHTIDDINKTIDFLTKSDVAHNAEYLECIRAKYREVMKFLKKLETYQYSLGRYIKYEGFHPDFAPEDVLIQNSPKVSDALENAKNSFTQCDKYLYKDK